MTMVHNNTSTGMKVSQNGEHVGVTTSDGWVKIMKRREPGCFIFAQRKHRLPVTCMGFRHDYNGEAEYAVTGSADYTYNIIYCHPSSISKTHCLVICRVGNEVVAQGHVLFGIFDGHIAIFLIFF